jgi:hypothetical protein
LDYRRMRRLDNVKPSAVEELRSALLVLQDTGTARVATLFYFGESPAKLTFNLSPGPWIKKTDSADPKWRGPSASPERIEGGDAVQLTLQPRSFVVYEQSNVDSRAHKN